MNSVRQTVPGTKRRACLLALIGVSGFISLSMDAQTPALGRSDPSFDQPSRARGVDYVLPDERGVKQKLDQIQDYFVRSTPYRIIDLRTGEPRQDLDHPTPFAGIDLRPGEFNGWDYPMGVVLASMLRITDVTGDTRYRAYALKNFDFIFDHLEFFRQQAKLFGLRPPDIAGLIDMRNLDDCGAMGAALIEAYAQKRDARYRTTIDVIADYISHKQMRLSDGTLARPRPQPVSLWADDFYMSIPFLAQMGQLTNERSYFDDAARQVIQMSARLQDKSSGLVDHSWFEDNSLENNKYDAKFYWGRATGWALMAMAELLTVLPEDHPDRARILEIFGRAVQGAAAVQSGSGMWHQLLDKPDSYPETSASAMITFAIARGVNRGWLSPVYAPVAQSGWQAVATHVHDDGRIDGICVSTTAAYDAVYYYNRPTDLRAMQGYGPVLIAGAEVIVMLRSFDIDRQLNTFHYRIKKAIKE